MIIYIASSWKNQHAVEMLTMLLRERGHKILSFVENNHGENPNSSANERAYNKPVPFDEWCASDDGTRSFDYDTRGATESDLVIYVGPSGTDAWAEVGAAWARGVLILGLWAKGEQAGLMRRMVEWFEDYRTLLSFVDEIEQAKPGTRLENAAPSTSSACPTCRGAGHMQNDTTGEIVPCWTCRPGGQVDKSLVPGRRWA